MSGRLPCCDEKYASIPKDVPVFTLIADRVG